MNLDLLQKDRLSILKYALIAYLFGVKNLFRTN